MEYSIFQKLRRYLLPTEKQLWVFGAWMGKKYCDNSQKLFEYVSKFHPEIKAVWITENLEVYNHINSLGFHVCMDGTPEAIDCCKKAFAYIYCVGFRDITSHTEFTNNRSHHIQLWHGLGIKRTIPAKESISKRIILNPFLSLLEYIGIRGSFITICTSDFFVPYAKEKFRIKKNVFVVGNPRLDILFNKEEPSAFIQALKKEYPSNAKFIMYMPTFRDVQITGESFNPFKSYGFDKERLNKILDEKNYVFIYKGHFWDGSLQHNYCSKRFVEIKDSPLLDIYDILKDCDICITDYSSIYYDFIFMNKPAILAAFDLDNYITSSRLLYEDYKLPSLIVRNWDELYNSLETESYFILEDKLRKKYHKFVDGNSSIRVFETISKL